MEVRKRDKLTRTIVTGLILFGFTSFFSLHAQWVKSYGGDKNDQTNSIQQTLDGGYIVAGSTESFGAGNSDLWVLKLSVAGDIEWQIAYGGSDDEGASSIQQTTDGGYIIAGSIRSSGAGSSDFWVLKISPQGGILWSKSYGGGADEDASSIQQTADRGYIIAGSTGSFGAGKGDFWVLKLSSQGDVEWQKTYGGQETDIARSVRQTLDGGYVVAGNTVSFGAGKWDGWILELSPLGDIRWQKTLGGEEVDNAKSIMQTTDGGYIVTGEVHIDVQILKLSPNREIEWKRAYKSESGGDLVKCIQQTSNGGYIVTGNTSLSGSTRSMSVWILKLWANGDFEWQKSYGAGFDDFAQALHPTNDGGYVVAGYTHSFGAGLDPRWHEGDSDSWILKLFSNGDLSPACGLVQNAKLVVTDTNILLSETVSIPQDTDVFPQNADVILTDTEATVYDFCSGKYILSIKAAQDGTTNPVAGRYIYDPGTAVSVEAIPEAENELFRWWGDASGEANPITITMDSHKAIKPSFGVPTDWGEADLDVGPRCFIATAAFDSQTHPYVRILHDFRDRYLMPHKIGRFFITFYYKFSPFAAKLISQHRVLKIAVQINLLPLVSICCITLLLGPIFSSILFGFVFVVPFLFIRYSKKKLTLF